MTAAELTTEFKVLSERVENLRRELDRLTTAHEQLKSAHQDGRVETNTIRVRLDEQVKRQDNWEGRRWMLFMAAVGVVSGLITATITAVVLKK